MVGLERQALVGSLGSFREFRELIDSDPSRSEHFASLAVRDEEARFQPGDHHTADPRIQDELRTGASRVQFDTNPARAAGGFRFVIETACCFSVNARMRADVMPAPHPIGVEYPADVPLANRPGDRARPGRLRRLHLQSGGYGSPPCRRLRSRRVTPGAGLPCPVLAVAARDACVRRLPTLWPRRPAPALPRGYRQRGRPAAVSRAGVPRRFRTLRMPPFLGQAIWTRGLEGWFRRLPRPRPPETSIPQVFSAVVQNTCRKLCQVHRDLLSAPRHSVAR
jgi:hypothetical protein